MTGFTFALSFIIGPDKNPSIDSCCDDNRDHSKVPLSTVPSIAFYVFQVLLGQQEWAPTASNECLSSNRSRIVQLYVMIFSVLGTVLMLNLLIAMMSSTYEQIREGTAKQVNFARAEQTYSLAHRNAIIPPPLNVFAFILSILWFIFEFLLFLISGANFILNIEKLVPVFINYDRDFIEYTNTNIRNDKKQLKCFGIMQKLKNKQIVCNLFSKYNSTARYCSFCRCYMRVNGNISHYFELFINYRLDEADVRFMESLMSTAGICPQCYRAYRKYDGNNKTNRLYRWQVILEILSFYVFLLCVYIPLIILIAIPAAYDACMSFIKDVTSATKIVQG
eukprot:199268_1